MSSTVRSKTAAFTVHKLASSLFRIVETDDVYSEHPFIYVKFLPGILVIVDTGCGGRTTKPDIEVTRLREFIETWPVPELGGEPLNPGGQRSYIIVCTHCHYDHIREFWSISTLFIGFVDIISTVCHDSCY